jgi:hypothetical protein
MAQANEKTPHYGAEFSEDRVYRYCLWRVWDSTKPLVMFIGLNPSTANESKNDNTISKLMKIAKHNGYGGFYMMNLFAVISKDPNILLSHPNPIGNNNGWLEKIAPLCATTVFAWGSFKQAEVRAKEVKAMFPNAHCLWQNKNGSPKHPLYCLDKQEIIHFNP